MTKLLNNFNVFLFNKFNTFKITYVQQWHLIGLISKLINALVHYINTLILPYNTITSIFGFCVLVAIILQLISGFFLSWYYIPEPGLIIELREEMFEETRYGYEIFQMHVKGVDIIFVLSYFHILKKIYLKNYITYESDGWMLGGYAFLWFHYVVGLGICLSASHLSDLTLTIAANMYWSLTNNTHKTYYIIFTNKHLNSDQLMRLMFLHYLSPWYFIYLVKLHVKFCHENWDATADKNVIEDKSGSYISWYYDALTKEFSEAMLWTSFIGIYFFFHSFEILAVHYSFFEKWNISEVDDLRFYGVAPHWYFRPLMGLLTIAPTHFEGVMWLFLYFILLSSTPIIYNLYISNFKEIRIIPTRLSKIQSSGFLILLFSMFLTASILPCGRYYYDAEGGYWGNFFLKWAYQFIYLYLGFLAPCSDSIETIVFGMTVYLKKYKNLSNVATKE